MQQEGFVSVDVRTGLLTIAEQSELNLSVEGRSTDPARLELTQDASFIGRA